MGYTPRLNGNFNGERYTSTDFPPKKVEGWAELDGFWTAGKSTIPRIFCPPSSRSKVVFWRHSLIFKASHISISVWSFECFWWTRFPIYLTKGFFWDLQHFQVQLTPGHAPHQGLEAALASWSYRDGDVVSPESASGGLHFCRIFESQPLEFIITYQNYGKFIIIFTHTLW